MSKLKKLVRGYDQLEEKVLVISLVFTVLLIFAQIIARKVFNNSITWSEELARYVFIWQIWLGTSIGFREDKHLQITIVRDRLKGKGQVVFDIIGRVIMLAFCVFLVIYGWQVVDRLMTTNYLSAALRMPLWIVYFVLPFSSLLIFLRILAKTVTDFKLLFSKKPLADQGMEV